MIQQQSKIWLTFVALLVINLVGLSAIQADDFREIMDLRGKWKFSIGDRASWASPKYDDREWESVNVPSPWENEGFHGYNGFAWYRKDFRIFEIPTDGSLYLFMGYIDDVDEVYVNGKLIGFSGTFPPRHKTAFNAMRRYPIPEELLYTDRPNVIAVRVYDSQIAGGIVGGDVGLYVKRARFNLDINLAGVWNFRLGDQMEWRYLSEDEGDWSKIIVPQRWDYQGYKRYDGFAWYQKAFCPNTRLASQDLILVLGKIDDTDQVFVNGKLIGSTGMDDRGPYDKHDTRSWQEWRAYRIPAYTLLVNEDNILTVRVHDWTENGGIYQGPVGIIRADRFDMRELRRL